jgi:acylphosphatase
MAMPTTRSTNDLHAIDVVDRGRVQGVGFRAFIRRNVMLLGLRGEVSNQTDGTVRAYIEGDRNRIEQMVHLLQEGPSLARVEQVEVEAAKPLGRHHTFEVGFND